MPDKGKIYSSADERPFATVYYDVYGEFINSNGRQLLGEFVTDTELDQVPGYILELQNGLKLDCTVEPYGFEPPDNYRYRFYI